LSQVVTFSDGVLIELKKNKSLVLLDLGGYWLWQSEKEKRNIGQQRILIFRE
jgi:hypothetical protein